MKWSGWRGLIRTAARVSGRAARKTFGNVPCPRSRTTGSPPFGERTTYAEPRAPRRSEYAGPAPATTGRTGDEGTNSVPVRRDHPARRVDLGVLAPQAAERLAVD